MYWVTIITRSLLILQSKTDYRKHFSRIRSELTPAERSLAAEKAAQHLAVHPLFLQSERIACYSATGVEIDLQPFMKLIWQAKKTCYLPVVMEGHTLSFACYHLNDELYKNQYGILEPEKKGRKVMPEALDLVLVPLLAFDDKGHRVGAGGGYYDRTFAFMHGKELKKPVLLGYGFDAQRATNVPADPWDIVLQGVVTESGVTRW